MITQSKIAAGRNNTTLLLISPNLIWVYFVTKNGENWVYSVTKNGRNWGVSESEARVCARAASLVIASDLMH